MEDLVTSLRNQSPLPMIFSHSTPFNEELQSMLRENGDGNDEDEEVINAFKKIRRRRNSRKNLTRRKGENKSRALSKLYDKAYMNRRSSSGRSESSQKRSESTTSRPMSRRKQLILESVGKPLKTRSAIRIERQEAQKEANKFYCEYSNCSVFFENFENFISHKIYDHLIPAFYFCEQCKNKYTNQNELDIHYRVHDRDTLFCCYCRAECQGARELQDHLKRHLDFTADCGFCFLSFLTKTELSQHVEREHRRDRKERKIKNSFFKLSMKRMKNNNNNNVVKKNFRVKILRNELAPSPDIFATLLHFKLTSENYYINNGVSPSNSDQSVNINNRTPTSLSRDVTTDDDSEYYSNDKNYNRMSLEDDLKLNYLKPVVVLTRLPEAQV